MTADRTLLTPFVLTEASPAYGKLRTPGSWLNQPTFVSRDQNARLKAIHAPLAEAVRQCVAAGDRPVSLAGDCCAVLPVIAGLQQAGIAPQLLWLDAHGDFNTHETSPSGFLGGMPLAMLVGRGDQSHLKALAMTPLAEADVTLFDARNLDPLEEVALRDSAVNRLTSLGALDRAELGARPLHVHLDVDVLDPHDCPSVHYPALGGPALADLDAALRRLVARARPVSVSVTTWIVDQDSSGRSQRSALQLLGAILGAA